jgi:hypothetical protein
VTILSEDDSVKRLHVREGIFLSCTTTEILGVDYAEQGRARK